MSFPDVLSRRAINRATLDRQMLLRRADRSAADAIEHLVGMQAQAPRAPFVGLWTRLADFRHEDLSQLVTSRDAVRAALMRRTLHLVSARDCLRLRPLMQPVLESGFWASPFARHVRDIDVDALLAAGRAAARGAAAHPRRAQPRTGRRVARPRPRITRLHRQLSRAARPGAPAWDVDRQRPGNLDDRRRLAGLAQRTRPQGRRIGAALPRAHSDRPASWTSRRGAA